MPSALIIQRTTVPASERDSYFERLKACESHYSAAGCTFRVFEEQALRGAFIMLVEADDETALTVANANSPYRILDPGRVYHETEIGNDAG